VENRTCLLLESYVLGSLVEVVNVAIFFLDPFHSDDGKSLSRGSFCGVYGASLS